MGTHPDEMARGAALLSDAGLWFWQPSPFDGLQLRVIGSGPAGLLLPWRTAGETSGAIRLSPVTPPDWESPVLVGNFHRTSIRHGDALLTVAIPGEVPDVTRDKLGHWLQRAVETTAGLYGVFPQARVNVIVEPVTWGTGPVPFGRVVRGGVGTVLFYVRPDQPLEQFLGDWTAVHEFSHLALPYIDREDAWLSEGLATYYQNLLRVRSGAIAEHAAWAAMVAGFARGRRETDQHQSLAAACREMHREGRYMRVYWSGVAYALTMDTRLRERSGGTQSLDSALRALRDCCLPAYRQWSGRELVRRLDQLSSPGGFETLYDRYRTSLSFPDTAALLTDLGVLPDGAAPGGVILSAAAPRAALRAAMMTGRAAAAARGDGATAVRE